MSASCALETAMTSSRRFRPLLVNHSALALLSLGLARLSKSPRCSSSSTIPTTLLGGTASEADSDACVRPSSAPT
jgi:hypothetical protein